MDVLLQDCTGAPRAHATKPYGEFFPLLDYQTAPGEQPTNQPYDDGCCCCFFYFFSSRKSIFLNIIITHLLHSHIHCDLDHSFSKLTQHDLHFFPSTDVKIFPTKREIFSLNTVGNTTQFQIFRRRGGNHVTWEVEGELLFL